MKIIKSLSLMNLGFVFEYGLKFLCFYVLITNLTPAQFGAFSLFLAFGQALFYFSGSWLLTPYVRAAVKEKQASASFNRSYTSFFAMTVVLFFLFVFSALLLRDYILYFLSLPYELFYAAVFFAFFYSAFNWFKHQFQVEENFYFFSFVSVLIYLFFLVLLVFSSGALNELNASVYYGAAIAFSAGAVYVILKRKYKIRLDIEGLKNIKRDFKTSLPFLFVYAGDYVYNWIDLFVINYLSGVYFAGIYSAHYKIFQVFVQIPMLFYKVIFPYFSRLLDSGKFSVKFYLGAFLKKASLPAVLGVILVSYTVPYLLRFMFDADYMAYINIFYIFMFAVMIEFYALYYYAVINTFSIFKVLVWVFALQAAVNFIGDIIFVPLFGIYGAAIGTLLAVLARFIAFRFIIYFKTGRSEKSSLIILTLFWLFFTGLISKNYYMQIIFASASVIYAAAAALTKKEEA